MILFFCKYSTLGKVTKEIMVMSNMWTVPSLTMTQCYIASWMCKSQNRAFPNFKEWNSLIWVKCLHKQPYYTNIQFKKMLGIVRHCYIKCNWQILEEISFEQEVYKWTHAYIGTITTSHHQHKDFLPSFLIKSVTRWRFTYSLLPNNQSAPPYQLPIVHYIITSPHHPTIHLQFATQ